MDLGHGTIRYRNDKHTQESETSEEHQPSKKTGYFYHPRVELASDGILLCYAVDKVLNFNLYQYTDPSVKPETDYKCYYVFKGPPKTQGSQLYYVYGKGFDVSYWTDRQHVY